LLGEGPHFEEWVNLKISGADCEAGRHIKATLGSKLKIIADFELNKVWFS
jgi:hypothetical protein